MANPDWSRPDGRCEDDLSVEKAELERLKETADEKKNRANKTRKAITLDI